MEKDPEHITADTIYFRIPFFVGAWGVALQEEVMRFRVWSGVGEISEDCPRGFWVCGQVGVYKLNKNVVGGLRRRVGIRRRVENSVGCLSEKRFFINKGNNVDDELESSRRPGYCQKELRVYTSVVESAFRQRRIWCKMASSFSSLTLNPYDVEGTSTR